MYADGFSTHKVLDSDKKTVLYRTHRNPRGGTKPNVEVYRPHLETGKDVFVGSVTENQGSFGSKFDVELGYHRLVIQPPAYNNPSWTFRSPTNGDKVIAWNEDEDGSVTMTDVRSKAVIARVENAAWSWSKFLCIKLYGAPTQEELDEVMVTSAATWLPQMT
jgi:hypothetical protein